tara:strand:- start:3939 stop:5183 length:1245 start_codon:yes stop_codon:yes gene_type:complete
MKIISDLQIHSRYSRACSKATTLQKLEEFARVKGLNLLGTADFQHPEWNKEIKRDLKEDNKGVLWSKTGFPFLWQTEISLIYTQDGKGRRVHHLIYAPNTGVADQIIEALGKKGRLDYDGRPIFGFNSIELVEMMMSISKNIEIIPAHIWTPHFSLMGEYNQFSKVEDCFKEKTKYIHAMETGMSSDPAMNWRISALDNFQMVSFSDSHSFWPWRLGREATIFDFEELSYNNFIRAIRSGEGLSSTIETFPDYGKYHFSGHRNCGISLDPNETNKLNKLCPKCNTKLTIGVADRVEQLADRPEGYKREKNAFPFVRLLPLHEVIAAVYDIKGLQSKGVWEVYNKLISSFGDELKILMEVSFEDLSKVVDVALARVIIKLREGKLDVDPGYDGVYGKLRLDDSERVVKQKSLMEF